MASNASKEERRVVIFDVGGVVADSPINAIREFCRARQIEDLNPFLFSSSAWHRLERDQLAWTDFPEAALAECRERQFQPGVALGVEGWRDLQKVIKSGYAQLRPEMLEAIHRLRQAGFVVCALTNNFAEAKGSAAAEALARFRSLFDHFIESASSGMRKPEVAFYQHALQTIGCRAEEAIFLDDIGKNLKPAAAMGIWTIHVENGRPKQYLEALQKLQALVKIPLSSEPSKL
ncbi:unnamed protein product [Durusdinium trenchii]|uniref:Acyl-CoA dehydrogenase family member 10 (ACAD-10) n=2 Tax=Durusdinium trenchii TaxID=1381693 RepID=A0ABP0SI45_9DINO